MIPSPVSVLAGEAFSFLCLNPAATLSPGQAEEITRVHDAYPALHDDEFVAANLERWIAD